MPIRTDITARTIKATRRITAGCRWASAMAAAGAGGAATTDIAVGVVADGTMADGTMADGMGAVRMVGAGITVAMAITAERA